MKKKTMAQEALEAAASMLGGQAALARAIGRTPQEVWNWLNRDDDGAPVEVCPLIAESVQHRVSCEQLRPDADWERLRRGIIGSSDPTQTPRNGKAAA